ncbi:MAG: hypothetical protein ABIH87_01190 [bacterium]
MSKDQENGKLIPEVELFKKRQEMEKEKEKKKEKELYWELKKKIMDQIDRNDIKILKDYGPFAIPGVQLFSDLRFIFRGGKYDRKIHEKLNMDMVGVLNRINDATDRKEYSILMSKIEALILDFKSGLEKNPAIVIDFEEFVKAQGDHNEDSE